MMRVHTFIGKANVEGLHQMDSHINDWIRRNGITPAFVNQTCGMERQHGQNDEPCVFVSVWYEIEEPVAP